MGNNGREPIIKIAGMGKSFGDFEALLPPALQFESDAGKSSDIEP